MGAACGTCINCEGNDRGIWDGSAWDGSACVRDPARLPNSAIAKVNLAFSLEVDLDGEKRVEISMSVVGSNKKDGRGDELRNLSYVRGRTPSRWHNLGKGTAEKDESSER